MPNRRYLFLVPNVETASGGTAVLHDVAGVLSGLGYSVVMVYESRSTVFKESRYRTETACTYEMRRARRASTGPLGKVRQWRSQIHDLARPGPNDWIQVKSNDVLVVPEFMLDLVQVAFPDAPKIVVVQNPFSYTRAYVATGRQGIDPNASVICTLAGSHICADAAEAARAKHVVYVPVVPDLAQFEFSEEKKLQIAYMPRKRRDEAQILSRALIERGRIAGFELVEVDRQPLAEVARIMRETLIFVSLMKDEGLGFPAIEAMSSGCVTLGYVALGGREFFDGTTGIPVADGDTMGLVRAIEATVEEYKEKPARLDSMRRSASERVNAQYARPVFEQALSKAWEEIDAS